MVVQLMAAGADVEPVVKMGAEREAALEMADIDDSELDAVVEVLQMRSDAILTALAGDGTLHRLCASSDVNGLTTTLRERPAMANACNKFGIPPLLMGAMAGGLDCVQALVAAGAESGFWQAGDYCL